MTTRLRYMLHQEKDICKSCAPFLSTVHLRRPGIRPGSRHSIWRWTPETEKTHMIITVVQVRGQKTGERIRWHSCMGPHKSTSYRILFRKRQVFELPAAHLSAECIRQLKPALCCMRHCIIDIQDPYASILSLRLTQSPGTRASGIIWDRAVDM